MFSDDKLFSKSEAYNLELGLYSSITDIVEAINTLVQKINNHKDTCITIKFSNVMHKKCNWRLKNRVWQFFVLTWDIYL